MRPRRCTRWSSGKPGSRFEMLGAAPSKACGRTYSRSRVRFR
jgi:hypothetical protein